MTSQEKRKMDLTLVVTHTDDNEVMVAGCAPTFLIYDIEFEAWESWKKTILSSATGFPDREHREAQISIPVKHLEEAFSDEASELPGVGGRRRLTLVLTRDDVNEIIVAGCAESFIAEDIDSEAWESWKKEMIYSVSGDGEREHREIMVEVPTKQLEAVFEPIHLDVEVI